MKKRRQYTKLPDIELTAQLDATTRAVTEAADEGVGRCESVLGQEHAAVAARYRGT